MINSYPIFLFQPTIDNTNSNSVSFLEIYLRLVISTPFVMKIENLLVEES